MCSAVKRKQREQTSQQFAELLKKRPHLWSEGETHLLLSIMENLDIRKYHNVDLFKKGVTHYVDWSEHSCMWTGMILECSSSFAV